MSIINKGTAFSNGEQLTADKINNMLDLATFNNSAVDLTSTSVNTSGQIVVADGGITSAKLATGAIATSNLEDSTSKTDGVTLPKIQFIDTAKILGRTTAGEGNIEELDFKTETDMVSDSDTAVASQKSIKAYVDGTVSAATNGYVKLPNGLIMQWGEYTDTSIAHGEDFDVSFPITFQTALLQVHGQPNDNAASVISQSHAQFQRIISTSTSGFTAEVGSFNGSNMNMTYKWNAIGH